MLKHFMNISWYNSIPVLKDGIRNAVFYSVTNRKPVYFSKVTFPSSPTPTTIYCVLLWISNRKRFDRERGSPTMRNYATIMATMWYKSF